MGTVGFEENSVLGFNYSESSIWSPLVPRHYSVLDLELSPPKPCCQIVGRKLLNSLNSQINATTAAITFNLKKKLKFNIMKSSGSSPFKKASTPTEKGHWTRVLRVTSKQFKRQKNKTKDPKVRATLATFLNSPNF